MFFHCGINEHLDQVWVWRSPLWIYFGEQLDYKGGLGKFVDSFRSSIASPHFSHFFLPLPIYEFLALVGGFKEMWKKKKAPPNLFQQEEWSKPLLGSWLSKLEKTRLENEHFCHGWSYYESVDSCNYSRCWTLFLMLCNNKKEWLGWRRGPRGTGMGKRRANWEIKTDIRAPG